jgi:glycosyltransferase involved in cell wall biosynthesis
MFRRRFAQKGIQYHCMGARPSYKDELLRFGSSFAPDVVYGITEGAADVVRSGSRHLGSACVFDLHGLGVVEIVELGRGFGRRIPRIRNSLRWIWQMRRADALTVANPTLVPVAKKLNRKSTLIAGIVDLELFKPSGPKVQLGPPERIQVLYAGNYLKWQGVDLLLDAAELSLRFKLPYDFNFVGTFGMGDDLLERWSNLLDSGHVRVLDPVDNSDIPPILRGADILTIPRPYMLSTYLAFPQKISDYMATGAAIVATDLKSHRYAIKDDFSGVLCKPSGEAILEGLLRLRHVEKRIFMATTLACSPSSISQRAWHASVPGTC